ncbi:MAG: hypothetical protein Q4F88_04885 [Eubacteriales bacterium]|nr:hypothetical protein [Eubacteriales bacterium]
MNNKKLNIFVFLSILLFLSINTFSIGVNDNASYITRAEFDTTITNINSKIISLESTIDNKIATYISSYPMNFEAGDNISLTLSPTTNKWVIAYASGGIRLSFTTVIMGGWTTSGTLVCLYDDVRRTLTIETNSLTTSSNNGGTQTPTMNWRLATDYGWGVITNRSNDTIVCSSAGILWSFSSNLLTMARNASFWTTAGAAYTFTFNNAVLFL